MKRKGLFLLVVLALLAAACGDDDDTETSATTAAPGEDEGALDEENPFEILAILPLSGALATSAEIMQAGIEEAVDVANENGGAAGRKIEVKFVDDALDGTRAASLLNEELARGKPDLVVTGAGSAEALAMLPILTRNEVFSIGITASAPANDPKTNPYHFNLVHPSADNMTPIRPYIEEEGVKRLGLFFSADALGESNLEATRAAFEGSDVELVVEQFNPQDLDLTGPMSRLQSGDVDAVFFSTYGPSAGYVLEARSKLGWDLPFFGEQAVASSNVASLVQPSDLEGVQILTVKEGAAIPDDDRLNPEGWNQMLNGIKERLGSIDSTLLHGVYGYEVVIAAKVAADKAGEGADGPALAKALESFEASDDVDKLLITFTDPGFSPDSHIVKARENDYVLVDATALKDGLLGEP